MFCPGCGAEEVERIRFCRKCGTELNTVRLALERPDAVAASANARDEVARAVAAKIADLKSGRDLSRTVEDVLPKIQAFLESPQEKRLRLIREGLVTASTGLGIVLISLAIIVAAHTWDAGLIPAGAGGLVFLVGLGIMAGSRFVIPGTDGTNPISALSPKGTATNGLGVNVPGSSRQELAEPERVRALLSPQSPPSVTEETTNLLGANGDPH